MTPPPPSPDDSPRARVHAQGNEQMSKHTPGPWKVDRTVALGAYGVWSEVLMRMICSVMSNNTSDLPREERDANAALIAEAAIAKARTA